MRIRRDWQRAGRCVRVLLDTRHALLWWFSDAPALPHHMQALIDDPANTIFVSAASAWEICTKVRIGKLPTGQGRYVRISTATFSASISRRCQSR